MVDAWWDDLVRRVLETGRLIASPVLRGVEFVKSIDTNAAEISSRDSRRRLIGTLGPMGIVQLIRRFH